MKHTRTQAIHKLTSARDRIATLRDSSANSPRFQHWNEETLRLILDLFPKGSDYEKDYRALPFGLLFDPSHKDGAPDHEQTYLESLAAAEQTLNALLTALGVPGAAPAGSSLAVDPSDAIGPKEDVVVLHGADEGMMARITPVIVAAERNRIAIHAWPEDPDTLGRRLSGLGIPHIALALVGEADLDASGTGPNDPPELPRAVQQAIGVAVTTFGADKVRVVVQSKVPLKPDQVPARMVRVDPRGQWRTTLGTLLKPSSDA